MGAIQICPAARQYVPSTTSTDSQHRQLRCSYFDFTTVTESHSVEITVFNQSSGGSVNSGYEMESGSDCQIKEGPFIRSFCFKYEETEHRLPTL